MRDRDEIIDELEQIAPPDIAESFDLGKIGLIIEGKRIIQKVCTCLDVTEKVVLEASRRGADLLIAHHTPLWYPLTRIRGDDASLLRLILGLDLNVYVMHTNYDHAEKGVNFCLSNLLGLDSIQRLSLGVVGNCQLTPAEIGTLLGTPIMIWGEVKMVRRLAVVGGSGFDIEVIREAEHAGAEAFLSAELRHSVYRSSPIPLLESTHYGLEAPAMKALAEQSGWTFLDDPPVLSAVL